MATKLMQNLVLLDFYAVWCNPCKMMEPIMEEIAKKVTVKRIDVDAEPEMAKKYNVMSIPTLILLKDDQIVKQVVGYQNKEALDKLLSL